MNRYLIILVLLALAAAAGVAMATPPANIAGTFLARGTTADPLVLAVPGRAFDTRWARVREKGKLRFRRISRKRTVLKPIIACSEKTECDVVVQSLVLQPAGTTGWHSHPGVLTVAVKSGTVKRYEAQATGCREQSYAAGQAFGERGAEHIILVRNESPQPAELLITYVVPAGTPNAGLRLDQHVPAGCPA
jgi:quercetin dioxygenase-like cupin family protein